MSTIERRFYLQERFGTPPPLPRLPFPGFFCLEDFKQQEIWTDIDVTLPKFTEARIRNHIVKKWKGLQVLLKAPRELADEWVDGFWYEVESREVVYRLGDQHLDGHYELDHVFFQKKVDEGWKKEKTIDACVMILCWQGDKDLLE
jgi:hypothetical protein